MLLSSHVLSEIQQTADEVAVLANGRVVADGDVASLRLGSIRRVRVAIATTDAAAVRADFERVPGLTGPDVRDVDGILQLSGTVDGAIDPFIKALAPLEVRDLTVEEPDLEESVLRLYGDAPASASTSASPTPATRRTRRARKEQR